MADYLNIAGRIRTTASDGVAMEAQEVKDLNLNKSQQEVNADVQTELGDRYTKEETYSKEQLNNLITTPDASYVNVVATSDTTAVTDVLPAEGAADTIYRVGNWDGTQYDPTMYALYAWNGSAYVCVAVRSFVGEVYDVSVNHPDGQGNPTPYADLAAALGTNGANIPVDIRRGGMSIKFIQGTVQSSDNKYVQYRLMADAWSTNPYFWERYNDVTTSNQQGSDLDFSDEYGNVLVRFQDGGIKTKNFDSSKDATEEERGLMSAEDKNNLNESVEKLSTIEEGAEVNNVETDNTVSSDLDFSDEQGNILIQAKNGHIKTKNFDSKYTVNFLEKFKGKSIGIIGDSISTFNGWLPSDVEGYDGSTYATYYPRGDVNVVEKTWWYKVCLSLGIDATTRLCNCAWSGSRISGDSDSITDAAAGCSNRRISDITIRGFVPDIIICFISCNDWSHEVPIGTWKVTDPIPSGGTITELRAAYALMLSKLHTSYPQSRIFCCTILDDFKRDETPGWPSNNGDGVSTYEWNQNIIEIAHALGCDVIDVHECGINYSNIGNFYSVDNGLHPNSAGQDLIAKRVINELITKY